MQVENAELIRRAYRNDNGRWTFHWDGEVTYLGDYIEDHITDEEISTYSSWLKRFDLIGADDETPLPDEYSNADTQRSPSEQFSRSTCVCFALVAAMEGCLKRKQVDVDLSEQFANWIFQTNKPDERWTWCCGGVRLVDGAKMLEHFRICVDSYCPYPEYMPNCERNTGVAPVAECTAGPSENAKNNARYRIAQSFVIGPKLANDPIDKTIVDIRYLQRIVASGKDIAISVGIAFGFMLNGIHMVDRSLGKSWVPDEDDSPGHALLIVGYGHVDNQLYFICKDSRGVAHHWTHGGYMWLSDDYIREYARYGVVITAVARDADVFGPALPPIV